MSDQLEPLTIRCVGGQGGTLRLAPPDSDNDVLLSMRRGFDESHVWIDHEMARQLFNWLGVYLHTGGGS